MGFLSEMKGEIDEKQERDCRTDSDSKAFKRHLLIVAYHRVTEQSGLWRAILLEKEACRAASISLFYRFSV